MKTYAVGIEKRVDTSGTAYYQSPCGSCHILQLDGRKNIQKHMDTTIGILKFMGYDNFVIIRVPSFLCNWESRIIWKNIEKNLHIILD